MPDTEVAPTLLEKYRQTLAHLAPVPAPNGFWPEKTRYQNPSKALLLLAVLDRLADEPAAEVELTHSLRSAYGLYFSAVVGGGQELPSVSEAFSALTEDGLWNLLPGAEGNRATLEPEFHELGSDAGARQELRKTLIDRHFSPAAATGLWALSHDRTALQSALQYILDHYQDGGLTGINADHVLRDAFDRAVAALKSFDTIAKHSNLVVPRVGGGTKPVVMWIPMYQPSAAGKPQQCVYVFRKDMSGVFLTIGQRQDGGDTGPLRQATLNAAEARLAGAVPGGIPYFFYTKDAIPPDRVLEQDLASVLDAYEQLTKPPPPPPPDSFKDLQARTFLPPEQLHELIELLQDRKQIIFEGPPGSGKTYIADLLARHFTGNALQGPTNGRVEMVQLHQSYGYEDFVEGIRPKTDESGDLKYEPQPGIFKTMCDTARQYDEQTAYVMVVDEINRGNLSRVFGELLLLLEYRDDKQVTLPYSRLQFTIPPNVYLIGTMNTADRSLAQIDYALRRRFYFYRLMPVVEGQAAVLEGWLGSQGFDTSWKKLLLRLFVNLNQEIADVLGEHFQIGHSYFMTKTAGSEEGLRRIWRWAISPLIEEYFYGRRDIEKLRQQFSLDHLLGAKTQADGVPETAPEPPSAAPTVEVAPD